MELVTEEKKEIDKVEYVIDYPDKLGTDVDVTIDGKGNVDATLLFELDGYTYNQYLYLNIDMMEELLKTAKEHKREWERYEKNIPVIDIGVTRVKVTTGRNAGKYGTITSLNADSIMVDFGGNVLVDDVRHPDAYWVNFENVEF